MCNLFENYPELLTVIKKDAFRNAKLFQIEEKLPEVPCEDYNDILFPYDDVVLEYTVIAGDYEVKVDSCVYISNSFKDNVLEISKKDGEIPDRFICVLNSYSNVMQNGAKEISLVGGQLYYTEETEKPKSDILYSGYVGHNKELYNFNLGAETPENMIDWFSTIMPHTLKIVNAISQPKLFVIRESSMKPYKIGKKIPRSHQRSKYIILDLNQIKTRYGLSGRGEGMSKAAHPRRAHRRILRDERFTNKRGKIVKVKATWVGDTEKQVGNKIYKVLLDE